MGLTEHTDVTDVIFFRSIWFSLFFSPLSSSLPSSRRACCRKGLASRHLASLMCLTTLWACATEATRPESSQTDLWQKCYNSATVKVTEAFKTHPALRLPAGFYIPASKGKDLNSIICSEVPSLLAVYIYIKTVEVNNIHQLATLQSSAAKPSSWHSCGRCYIPAVHNLPEYYNLCCFNTKLDNETYL